MRLIKVDRNGSKHYEGMVTCDRCGGLGYYAIAINNGAPVLSPLDNGVCWKCGGVGEVMGKWIERTPEYQAKLDARREAKRKAQAEEQERKQAEWEQAKAEREAEEQRKREEREAKIKAEKAISQYVGNVGDKIAMQVTYTGSAHFEVTAYNGFGKDTMYVHFFKDTDGNKLVWKTGKPLGTWLDNGDWQGYEEGDTVMLKGTIKEHKEYKDEKQTVLTRCKVERSK